MNVQTRRREETPERFADKAAFLAWMRVHEGRFEFVDGRVVEMPGASLGHCDLAHFITVELRRQLPRREWTISASDLAVEIGETVRFPDVMVVPRGANRDVNSIADPVLVVEIISPSSRNIDLRVKRSEYLGLPTLRGYLVFDQDEPHAFAWLRGPDGHFAEAPAEFEGLDARIELSFLSCSLALSALYETDPPADHPAR